MGSMQKMTELTPLAHQQLTFITTDNCTAACPHCLMNCEPGLKHYLNFEQMKKAIDSYRAMETLRIVIFTGGEPTLLGEELLKTIRYCHSLGVMTRIVSNAHWASTPERAEKMLTSLREAGLDEINMSMDDFHAPYVPIENIRTAWKAIKGKGFYSAVIANSHGAEDTITPDFIQEFLGEKLYVRPALQISPPSNPDRGEDGTLYLIAEGMLQKIGRAEAEIAEDKYSHGEKAVYGGCCNVLAQPCVSFTNHVWGCCGVRCEDNAVLNLGNLDENTLGEIMTRRQDSVLINALHYIGPVKLWEMMCMLDSSLDREKEFRTTCECCEELTTNEKTLALLRVNLPALAAAVRLVKNKMKEQKDEGSPDSDTKA